MNTATVTATVSEAVWKKANRLLATDRIRALKGHTFEVVGDHGIYVVAVSYPPAATGSCTCDSREPVCSHLFACCVWELAHPGELDRYMPEGDPFAGL